ncbi:insulinase family protein [Clostridium botulinum]|uniref:Peptidase, M16 family n=1 Tax=Clostridium botulinum D str. 1873 TaxID=592027 RepID=A0A9P2G6E7_CLOBO|nr:MULTISPECIES: pitrilysin family protein [Clostridium]EES90793.1 peptidase, M16 family [Clostridium botulinum D str. 1873]MBO3442054.1 insulinase family protein [Clostridium haemolyticum]NFV46445.1 insulinase family protein [Clostridium botulinum]QPW55990.1 insulinase family protein [Clostridium botulinum]
MDKSIFDLKKYTLNNGINLITIRKDTQLAAINLGVKIGSIYENKDEKGIAHFVEHMLFKGTKNRDNKTLNEELEQRAGEYNAYTDYTATVYSITALKEELEKSLELFSDMAQNSIFSEEEMEKERGVILAEIRTSKDDIEDYSYKKTIEYAFKKSPIRINTIGTDKSVKSFTRENLVNFYEKYYVPNNTYITVVSSKNHEEVLKLVEKYFANWKTKEVKRSKVIYEDNISCKKISYKKDIEQSTIIYLYTFHNLDKKEELALRILNYKLGESANSLLFRKLREEKGLAYDIYSELDATKNVKILNIYTAVNEEDVEESLKLIDNIISDIVNEKIILDDSSVALMKKVLKTAVVQTLEDSTELGNYILYQVMDNADIYEFVDDMNNMENIKGEDIYNVAKTVLKNPTIHILLSEKSDK